MKNYILISTLVIFLFLPRVVKAETPVELYYFYENDCSACSDMSDTLEFLRNKYTGTMISRFDVTDDLVKRTIFNDLLDIYREPQTSVPTVFVGSDVFVGYTALSTNEIETAIQYCQLNNCPSPSELLKDYYASLSGEETDNTSKIVFWTIFIVAWPLLGAVAVIIVLRKYKDKDIQG
ncbi:hypothetical protein KKG41_04435 [Patescibacteria group bacterium]|nr:hypothetical protein [Patescibacteria group bacterium]MBU1889926.1 hypothetical protein [Patescibacteria group bacterium]